MRGMFAGLGALLFFFIAPGTVAGLVPWWIARFRVDAPFLGTPATRIIGVLLIVAGPVPWWNPLSAL